ncbi:hypothetical protein [Occallatibacter savannae]|uniref:hypothetical protein n=1 Tax=Occallatibacter savannae TaxID=1002691 RepID=UPI000D6870EB|nr:hypothetical protein [Occallatibacter savannae]
MFDAYTRKQVREDAIEESRMNEEAEARAAAKLKKFYIAAVVSGVLLILTIVTIVPFLAGHSLHSRWEDIGRYLVMLAMGLLPVFMFSAALSFGLWRYSRGLRAIHRKYAPPLNKHRTGTHSKQD